MVFATHISRNPNLESVATSNDYAPGVILFTTALQVVYMNAEARTLATNINRGPEGQRVNGVLPVEVFSVCEEIAAQMRRQTERRDLERIVVRRVLGDPRKPIQVLGFGILEPEGIEHSHLLLLLDDLQRAVGYSPEEIKERFSLTDREEHTLRYLLKGLTNKEIATELKISEHTVKAHVKHIMQKTNVTTRSAVIAQVHAY